MWLTCLIAGAFFAAFIAVEYFAVKDREEEAEREKARRALRAAQPFDVRQDAARGLAVTRDEVVQQLEHRIDEELRDISYAMRAPERHRQIFDA